uniref:Atx10homo_assoc domain-containing protein n=1 Tax=Meloidogyne hapla TaxID=6305 RepID=A0A1I8B440_MELHA
MNRDTKRCVILSLLDGMESHLEEQVMVRNCCLSLCQFDIPQEILFNYGRVANLLVKVLETHNSDVLTQRIVVFLLNSMACHVEGEQKVEVGEIGAIEIILKQIERKLSMNTCDDVMEVGWSFLWNITDETPSNCERFLRAHGLILFSKCFSRFGSRYFELVRNMMGLIGNIAEVFELRNQLMTNAYLEIFCHLLDNLTESIEISYNSAGVLAHLVSDGDDRWAESGVNIPREDVNRKIVKATEKWDLQARRFINYRSFKPIIRLLPQWHSEGAQQWAVWALANLTTTDRKKYCRFVIEEGGLQVLENLAVDERSTEGIKNLANIVLKNIDECESTLLQNKIFELLDGACSEIRVSCAADKSRSTFDCNHVFIRLEYDTEIGKRKTDYWPRSIEEAIKRCEKYLIKHRITEVEVNYEQLRPSNNSTNEITESQQFETIRIVYMNETGAIPEICVYRRNEDRRLIPIESDGHARLAGKSSATPHHTIQQVYVYDMPIMFGKAAFDEWTFFKRSDPKSYSAAFEMLPSEQQLAIKILM